MERRTPPRAGCALALLVAGLASASCTRSPAPAAGPATATAAPPEAGASSARAAPPVHPPFHCLSAADPPVAALEREADGALESNDLDRALGCADEALRRAPRSVRSLAARGEALAGLTRVPEAQLAFARALALDPDDLLALAGAADLHVRQLGGSHDALEAGLAQAERGLRLLRRAPRPDPALAVRLELAAAAALDDLGRPREALAHAERAVRAAPDEPAATAERGFALFELCRFDEARAAFQATLKLAPDHAWAEYHLGLLAERRGDEAEASRRLARARALAPEDFPPEVAIDRAAFQAELDRAVAGLSPADRAALRGVAVQAQDLPALDDLKDGEVPLSPTILGLFRGPPLGERCQPEDGDPCRVVVLYRKNLARFARDRAELDRQLRITLTHELGHLRGEDDDALRDRGLE